MKNTDYETLLKEAQNGNQEALAQLIAALYPRMFETAGMYTDNESDAQDIVQDAVLRFTGRLEKIEDPEQMMITAEQAVKTTAAEFARSSRNREVLMGDDEELSSSAESGNPSKETPESIVMEEAARDIVKGVLTALPEEQRAVAVMYFYEGMSVKEIADELHIDAATVAGRLNTAKKNIKAFVEAIQKRDDIRLY